jgi:hypothetical protein
MAIFLNKGKNFIINGAMDFWQRGTSFISPSNAYVSDRWFYIKSSTATHTISRSTSVPSLSQSGFIFPSSIRFNLTNPQGTLASNGFVVLEHRIEGIIFAPLASKPITISFWVNATRTGIYSVYFRNQNLTRSFVSTYTINQSNTWEKKSITLTHDTNGTWNYANSIGLHVGFALAAGSSYSIPSLNTWADGDFISHSSCINGVQSGSTDFFITGVQIEEGISASNFERSGGSLSHELQLCQRYFEKTYDLDVAPGTSTPVGRYAFRPSSLGVMNNSSWLYIPFKVQKRAVPMVAPYASAAANQTPRFSDFSSVTRVCSATEINTNGFSWKHGDSSSTDGVFLHWTADAEL